MTPSFFAQVKAIYPNFGAQLKLCALRSSPRELLPSVYFKGTHLFNHNRYFIFPNLTVGNSIYPTLAFAGDKSPGGIILGAEVPVALEMYYGDVESDYFFMGIGLAACAYALREHESFYGFGPYLAFGGDVFLFGEEILDGSSTLHFITRKRLPYILISGFFIKLAMAIR